MSFPPGSCSVRFSAWVAFRSRALSEMSQRECPLPTVSQRECPLPRWPPACPVCHILVPTVMPGPSRRAAAPASGRSRPRLCPRNGAPLAVNLSVSSWRVRSPQHPAGRGGGSGTVFLVVMQCRVRSGWWSGAWAPGPGHLGARATCPPHSCVVFLGDWASVGLSFRTCTTGTVTASISWACRDRSGGCQ